MNFFIQNNHFYIQLVMIFNFFMARNKSVSLVWIFWSWFLEFNQKWQNGLCWIASLTPKIDNSRRYLNLANTGIRKYWNSFAGRKFSDNHRGVCWIAVMQQGKRPVFPQNGFNADNLFIKKIKNILLNLAFIVLLASTKYLSLKNQRKNNY